MKKQAFVPGALLWMLLAVCSCRPARNSTAPVTNLINELRLIGQYEIPYNLLFDSTVVGGLSGIDYDPGEEVYYLISDDRSFINPARFYSAKISFSSKGIDTIKFISVNILQRSAGGSYPAFKKDKFNAPDPEGIRYYRPGHNLVWSNEGERIVRPTDTVLQPPSIQFMTMNGAYESNFLLPKNVLPQVIEQGSRQNGVFEGLTFADNFNTLYASLEEPLFQDGPRASFSENQSITRILKFDVATRKQVAQYAYRLSPVANQPIPPTAYSINGIADVLEAGPEQLFVVERSYSTGSMHCTIRVFLSSFAAATNIAALHSLRPPTAFREATKKLLLNMDTLGIYIDNIEAVCYGPILPNGHKTLLFVSDNNFNILEKTQLLWFEVL